MAKAPKSKPRAHLRVTIENVENGYVVDCYRADSFTSGSRKGVAKTLDQAIDLAKEHFANPPKAEKAEPGQPATMGSGGGY